MCRIHYAREWLRKNPVKAHESGLKSRYKVRVGTYARLLTRQGGRCAICSRKPAERRLGVDHNHETGAIRGLLCDRCNRGLGYFGDSAETVLTAAAYLQQHAKKQEVVALASD